MLSSPKGISYGFDEFNVQDYLKEYYAQLNTENKFLLKCCHQFYLTLSPQTSLLDIGGGPTIYSLISASSKVKEITFAEYNPNNRAAVAAWVNNAPEKYNWDPYFQFVSDLENSKKSIKLTEEIKERLRSKLTSIVPCNLLVKEPMPSCKKKKFDVVSSSFCSESITDKQDKFLKAIRNIFSFVNEKGHLLLSMLLGAHCYKVGNKFYPAFNICEKDIQALLLEENAFKKIQIHSIQADPGGKGYKGIMVIHAEKV